MSDEFPDPPSPPAPARHREDYEQLGRERYFDLTPEQRRDALANVVHDSSAPFTNRASKAFARGWLAELARAREARAARRGT